MDFISLFTLALVVVARLAIEKKNYVVYSEMRARVSEEGNGSTHKNSQTQVQRAKGHKMIMF
jgi:hypothetical protein